MARPQKEGMDYFPHDVNARNDKKIKMLRTLYGSKGYLFYFVMLEHIYNENTFCLDVSEAETREEIFQLIARDMEITLDEFKEIFETALKWGCYDKQLYEEKGIITSNGIQKRAAVVLDKREKMRLKYQQFKDGISEAETTPETEEETPQRKEKKRKEKESKEKVNNFIPPTLTEVKKFCIERKNNVDPEKFIDFYSSKGWMVGKNKMKDWEACVRTWEKKDKEASYGSDRFNHKSEDTQNATENDKWAGKVRCLK